MRTAFMLGLLSLCTACVDSKQTATRDNFELALASYFKLNTLQSCPLTSLAAKLPGRTLHYPIEATANLLASTGEEEESLLELEKLGFLTITPVQHLTSTTYQINVTETGVPHPDFCIGPYEFGHLVDFSAPTDTPDGKLSYADITLDVRFADWAQVEAVQKGFTFAKNHLDATPATATLRLGEQGWKVIGVQLKK